MLTLFEEFFLLTIHEERGAVHSFALEKLPQGVSGAVLAELALQGKLRVGEGHRLDLVDPAPTGDEILDEALRKIAAADRPRKVNTWIAALGDKPKRIAARLGERLVEKQVLEEEEDRWRWVVPYAECPEQNASAKYWVKSRLRAQALAGGGVEARSLALLGLVSACDLLDFVFTREERKAARRRIYELMVGEALRNPLVQAVEEIASALESLVEEE